MYEEYVVRVYNDRTEWYDKEEAYHRKDGPAVEYKNGYYKAWYLNGKLHREDGPAREWNNGSKFWYLNGNLHREDGPAKVFADGSKFWYLNGMELTKEEFNNRKKNCLDKIITINGEDFKLVKV